MAERDPLLVEREQTHGKFTVTAEISQKLKAVFDGYDVDLGTIHREVLDMTAIKIARILSGDPYFPGHWDDIIGYARLALEAKPD